MYYTIIDILIYILYTIYIYIIYTCIEIYYTTIYFTYKLYFTCTVYHTYNTYSWFVWFLLLVLRGLQQRRRHGELNVTQSCQGRQGPDVVRRSSCATEMDAKHQVPQRFWKGGNKKKHPPFFFCHPSGWKDEIFSHGIFLVNSRPGIPFSHGRWVLERDGSPVCCDSCGSYPFWQEATNRMRTSLEPLICVPLFEW